MKKIGKMNEAAWLLGIILVALGVALSTKAGFGLSMIASVPYIIHLKMVTVFSWYTQGTSEYIFQALLLVLTCVILKRFRIKYIFSFLTAFLSGLAIDGWLFLLGGGAVFESMLIRIISFIVGSFTTALAVAFYFKTDMPLQIYELFVKEVAIISNQEISKIKRIYDISSLTLALILAILLNKSMQGIGIGTIVVTIINAPLINMFGKALDKIFVFDTAFPKLSKTK